MTGSATESPNLLSARLLRSRPELAEAALPLLNASLPERVIQFGEGNFLRAFADWMLDRLNQRGAFLGRAVLVQPIATGMTDAINRQDGLYTVVLRGIEDGNVVEKRELVTAVSRAIDPYRDFDAFLECAKNPELRFVVSNTTEAGIRVDPSDHVDARPSASFPGKLTQFLYARFQHFSADPARGVVFLPCELIEQNGETLRRAVLETARSFGLPAEFERWLSESSVFTNTLVDRIVTGYPKDEATRFAEELGYEDALVVAGEVFHSWVIEGPESLEQELPLRSAGLNVTWTTDVKPYRERKVRILNGAHTMLALAAYLSGKETVLDCMEDPAFYGYVDAGLREEILPTLTLPREELTSFAESVLSRFKNPFIKHQLLSISLNSVSKYKARILGTVIDYHERFGEPPPRLSFALAALLAFYRGQELREGALWGERQGEPYRILDEANVLEFFHRVWSKAPRGPCTRQFCSDLVAETLSREDFWGQDIEKTLPQFSRSVAENLHRICETSVQSAIGTLGSRI